MATAEQDKLGAARVVHGVVDRQAQPTDAERPSFEDVYRRHERDVVRYLTLMIGNADDAQDLAADTFRRALEAWRDGRGPAGRTLPWLLTIARRLVLNRWRRRAVMGSTPPGPTPPGYRSEVVDGLEILRGAWDGESLLAYRKGWGPCFRGADVLTRGPDTAEIDAAADTAGLDEGLIDGSDHESVALASTLEAAARAYGSRFVTVDGWIVIQGTGRRLMSWQTPKAGRSGGRSAS